MTDQLQAIAEIVNAHEAYWAEVGDDTYLIRFQRLDDDGNNLVLMYDHGVTWEPFRAYPTPRYCTVPIDDAEAAAKNLMKLADAYKNGELPMNAPDDSFQHLID